jgi:hypothetical protein
MKQIIIGLYTFVCIRPLIFFLVKGVETGAYYVSFFMKGNS